MKVLAIVFTMLVSGISFYGGFIEGKKISYNSGYTVGYKVGQSNSNILGDGVYFGLSQAIPNATSVWTAVVRYNGTNSVISDTNSRATVTWGQWQKLSVSVDRLSMTLKEIKK